MIRGFLILLLITPQLLWAQADQIILPELDLVIDDQSTIQTFNEAEVAILRERTPQFEEVYLDELSTGLSDASINASLAQRNQVKRSLIQFSYGSFHDTKIKALSQNMVEKLFYRVSYQGNFRQNTSFNGIEFANTSFIKNLLDTHWVFDVGKVLMTIDLSYKQQQHNFITNDLYNQNTHYIPITFETRAWVNDYSHIDFSAHTGFTYLDFQNIEGLSTTNDFLADGVLDLAYKANFKDWNYFEITTVYTFNELASSKVHTGEMALKSEFLLGKGVGLTIGAGIIASSVKDFFAWPEFALTYDYMEIFNMAFSISGDFSVYSAQKASQEVQFYSLAPTPESLWIYKFSFQTQPSPYFRMGGNLSYTDYQHKRIYDYDKQTGLYDFVLSSRVGVLGAGIFIKGEVPKFFSLIMAYTYEGIQEDWFLYAPHKFDLIMNVGYKPVGFNFQIQYTVIADRNLTSVYEASTAQLLSISISQNIKDFITLSIEVQNILNQNVQFLSGTYYGGIQARGGFTLNF